MKTSNTFPSHSYESYAAWTCSLSRRLALHEGGWKKNTKPLPPPPFFFFKYQQILCMTESHITKLIMQMVILSIVEQRYLFYFNAAVKKSTLARLQLDTGSISGLPSTSKIGTYWDKPTTQLQRWWRAGAPFMWGEAGVLGLFSLEKRCFKGAYSVHLEDIPPTPWHCRQECPTFSTYEQICIEISCNLTMQYPFWFEMLFLCINKMWYWRSQSHKLIQPSYLQLKYFTWNTFPSPVLSFRVHQTEHQSFSTLLSYFTTSGIFPGRKLRTKNMLAIISLTLSPTNTSLWVLTPVDCRDLSNPAQSVLSL